MDVQVNVSGRTAAAADGQTVTPPAVAPADAAEPVLQGPAVKVLPPDLSQQYYETMKAVADNLKPSEKETKLKAQRLKEVRARARAEEIREKDDLRKEIERERAGAETV